MARPSHGCKLLIAAGLALAAGPASAQFGSIFREEPPRPPAEVPSSGPNSGPNNFPPPAQAYPQSYPHTTYPPRQDYPYQDRRVVQPPAPTNAGLPQQPDPRGGRGGIEAQPLPPPPGGNAAPARGAAPQPSPGGPTQSPSGAAVPGQPPGAAQPGAAQPGQPADAGALTKEVVVEPPPNPVVNPTAVFAGLDKITGRIISFDVAINETVQFGALQVTPKVCFSRAPTEPPRTDAFVDVDEVTLKGEVKRIFTGWMFASSPALHAVEHPIYDVWLTDCKGAKQTIAEGGEKGEQASAREPPPVPARRPARRR